MAVQEKYVPRLLSLSATFASAGICVWLWAMGNQDPRKYVARMAVNHHDNYGSLACYECHVPAGGRSALSTSLTCATASCHGELLPEKDAASARHVFVAEKGEKYIADGPRISERADHHIALHSAVREQACWSCHSEHTAKTSATVPPGWKTFREEVLENQASLRGTEGGSSGD